MCFAEDKPVEATEAPSQESAAAASADAAQSKDDEPEASRESAEVELRIEEPGDKEAAGMTVLMP